MTRIVKARRRSSYAGKLTTGSRAGDARLAIAKDIIQAAEKDLGPLSEGQKRDLLKDNTSWSSEAVARVVKHLGERRF